MNINPQIKAALKSFERKTRLNLKDVNRLITNTQRASILTTAALLCAIAFYAGTKF